MKAPPPEAIGPPPLCGEITGRERNIPTLERGRYHRLHASGRRMARGWYDKAIQSFQADGAAPLEAFMFAWIALNAWGACVTDEDRDRAYVLGLAESQYLRSEFDKLRQTDKEFNAAVLQFAGFWPICDVRKLRELGLLHVRPEEEPRQSRVAFYLERGATVVAPECWLRHLAAGEDPTDWPHVLSALHRVRNNLFHGEKSADSEMDRSIVASAFQVLFRFMSSAELLG
jgi:hypothetical protein